MAGEFAGAVMVTVAVVFPPTLMLEGERVTTPVVVMSGSMVMVRDAWALIPFESVTTNVMDADSADIGVPESAPLVERERLSPMPKLANGPPWVQV